MPDISSFLPLSRQTVNRVRARVFRDMNAGVDPASRSFWDQTPGGFAYDLSNGPVLEITRAWEGVNEAAAVAFPQYAWGDYLDDHAEMIGIARKDAVQATGDVTFTGTAGTAIPSGTRVAAALTDPDADAIEFLTTSALTLPGTVIPTSPSGANAAGGSLAATTTYYYVITQVISGVESLPTSEFSVATTGVNKTIDLSWTINGSATASRIYRGTASGDYAFLAEVTAPTATYSDTGAVSPSPGTPPTNRVSVEADVAGPEANVAAGLITVLITPVDGITAVTNIAATSGGADVESDEDLSARILLTYSANVGAGTAADYQRWALEDASVGRVTVQPQWSGAGTVRLFVMDTDNKPLSATVVARVQTAIDPVAGQGAGKAPVGSEVTIATPTLNSVYASAQLTLGTGYSLDGTGGTIAVRDSVQDAISAYVDRLDVSANVILEKVQAQIMSVQGVENIVSTMVGAQLVTIRGGATGGTFTLTFNGQTTGTIAYNAAAATVQTALEALSNVAPGDVIVSGNAGGPWTVVFAATLAATSVFLTANGASLTGGTNPNVLVTATDKPVGSSEVATLAGVTLT